MRRISGLVAVSLLPFAGASATDTDVAALLERLEQQEQKTLILERKLELKAEADQAVQSTAPAVKVGPGGISFESADKSSALRLRAHVDIDGTFFADDADLGGVDKWEAARIRPYIEGSLGKLVDFRIMPDFGRGQSQIIDAYLTLKFDPRIQLTVGKFKSPLGLERLQSSAGIRFIERAFPTSLVPNRDFGLQLGGNVLSNKLTWQLAWLNGASDGGSVDTDVNDDKEWVGRLFAHPFAGSDSVLRGLGIGIAGSYTDQTGGVSQTLLAGARTSARQTFFSYRSNAAATDTSPATNATYADGKRVRWSPQLYYYYGPFGLLSEYVRVSQDVSRTPVAGDPTRSATLDNDAWQLQVGWFLTGEEQGFRNPKPNADFKVGAPGWGAFEVVARVHQLKIDDEAFTGGSSSFANPNSAAREATAFAVGLNWHLNQNVKIVTDYEQTRFEGGLAGGADRDDEKAFLTRFELVF